ncbi:hypothetical protein LPJ66_010042 [Kickxella alabastrina]|uniref:Uncharacterized protein n=1 Tax=Kickxella alabastrina TaxID=61397 RepID=A0ACC1I7R8_9FUNG|nr:hypothetical protein LPJ66_010042 [Kickxella alabastrina]
MQPRTKSLRSSLRQPFKSPQRSSTPFLTNKTTGKADMVTPNSKTDGTKPTINGTLTPASRKRPTLLETSPSLSSLLSSTHTTPKKRPRLTPLKISKSTGKITNLLSPIDKVSRALVQEKSSLQRQLTNIKEERALLERAITLKEKNEAVVVNDLISKWQSACLDACKDLFKLLKPLMEAQRQADAMGFSQSGLNGGSVFDQGKSMQQTHDNSGNDADAHQDDEDIDVTYMLKRLGIDPDLF